MTISQSKLSHLEKLATQKGIIAAAAMDQRGSLKKSIAKEKGVDPSQITDAMMSEFKTIVTKVLTPYASAILLEPEFGLEAAKNRAKNAGLLLAYETTGYEQNTDGRVPRLIQNWTVSQSIEEGANAIKILLYYSPFEKKEINDIKHAWVERIGAECAFHDIPYFLEFVGYPVDNADEKGLTYAKLKPEIVTQSVIEFSKHRYHVDVLKIEVPVNMQFVKGAKACKGEIAYTREEAISLFQKSAAVTSKPFIYLSAGVSDDEFRESLELAIEAKIPFNGVLCGRATWKDAIPVYAKEGAKALEAWLLDRGVKNIQALNAVLEKGAHSFKERI